MAATILPKIITVPPTGKHTATFFFFHGSGEFSLLLKKYKREVINLLYYDMCVYLPFLIGSHCENRQL